MKTMTGTKTKSLLNTNTFKGGSIMKAKRTASIITALVVAFLFILSAAAPRAEAGCQDTKAPAGPVTIGGKQMAPCSATTQGAITSTPRTGASSKGVIMKASSAMCLPHSSPVGNHLYTTSQAEANNLKSAGLMKYEGITGYVYTSAQPGTAKLYRFAGKRPDHMLTTNQNEAFGLIVNFAVKNEGIIGHMVVNTTVPNLVGKTQAQAQAALQAVGLGANVTYNNVLGRPDLDTKVSAQNPVAGQIAKMGGGVSLAVYKNVPRVIPPFKRAVTRKEDYKKLIEALELRVFNEPNVCGQTQGTLNKLMHGVIPAPGTVVNKGAPITIQWCFY